MRVAKYLALSCGVALCFAFANSNEAEAGYYSQWRSYPSRNYHYTQYYYKPYPRYPTYRYHYCVYRTYQPRYVYYYNPYRRVYWGRLDTQAKEGSQYQLLAEKDRKGTLKEIPESAFPKGGKMPTITDEAIEGAQETDPIEVPDLEQLPKADS
jgi:hypothetical protein